MDGYDPLFWHVMDRLTEGTNRMRTIRATGGKIKTEHIRKLEMLAGDIKRMVEEYAAISRD